MTGKPVKIFVVEDNEWYNKLLVYTLSLNPDYEVKSFLNARDFLNSLHESPDIVTLDFKLPDLTGLDVLKRIRQENGNIQVILVSEQDDIETAVTLLKLGAYDYITKSNDIKERLLNTVQNITRDIGLRNEISTLRKEVQQKYSFRNTIIGDSAAIKNVFGLIEKALETNITVIISGETGTGKELVAKAIHYNSRRKDKPFVAVNVPAIPSELIESELFGHEKGAFTGASFRRTGRFEEADGGSLFLDEIGEMEMNLQTKLLRVLQEKEIVRIGSNKPVKTDCRIIAATNRNLKEEVRKGKFREDLYYRLLGLPIEMPPLRERGNDILMLAGFFIERFCRENNLPVKRLSPGAQKKLLNYSFPGNVRELKSIVELAVTLSVNNQIEAADFTFEDHGPSLIPDEGDLTMREYEMKILRATLKKYNNDIPLTARKLDIGVSTIYRLLRQERKSEE
ncbi:MAG TPA: sigma-54 dependent transcriptional regulator [Bacteroidales bacterium]|jgi:DNA-binding NtrC family response regulator|nr:sigma-54 dependent transcriptional regulator [Bacteroidales bacterium]